MTANPALERKSFSQAVKSKWGWFFALGVILIIGGSLAIILPAASTLATSIFLGAILLVGGVVQIFHAFQVTTWKGFFWVWRSASYRSSAALSSISILSPGLWR